jgi:hypothetical protein
MAALSRASSGAATEPLLAEARSAGGRPPSDRARGGGTGGEGGGGAAGGGARGAPPGRAGEGAAGCGRPAGGRPQPLASGDLDMLLLLDSQDSGPTPRPHAAGNGRRSGSSGSGGGGAAAAAASGPPATAPARGPQQRVARPSAFAQRPLQSGWPTAVDAAQGAASSAAGAAAATKPPARALAQRPTPLATAPSEDSLGLPNGLLPGPLWLPQQPLEGGGASQALLSLAAFASPADLGASPVPAPWEAQEDGASPFSEAPDAAGGSGGGGGGGLESVSASGGRGAEGADVALDGGMAQLPCGGPCNSGSSGSGSQGAPSSGAAGGAGPAAGAGSADAGFPRPAAGPDSPPGSSDSPDGADAHLPPVARHGRAGSHLEHWLGPAAAPGGEEGEPGWGGPLRRTSQSSQGGAAATAVAVPAPSRGPHLSWGFERRAAAHHGPAAADFGSGSGGGPRSGGGDGFLAGSWLQALGRGGLDARSTLEEEGESAEEGERAADEEEGEEEAGASGSGVAFAPRAVVRLRPEGREPLAAGKVAAAAFSPAAVAAGRGAPGAGWDDPDEFDGPSALLA